MNADVLFLIFNVLVLPGWILLLWLPAGRWTERVIHSGALPCTLAVFYLLLVLLYFGRTPGSFTTLGGVQQLFSNPYLLLAGWIHYLAFDLWVGAWIARDADRRGIGRAFVAPCLLLTLFFGPIGFLAYHALLMKKYAGGRPS